MSEQTLAIVSDEIELPVDLLNREAFVNNLISVCSILSANKKNACYSINGEWGSGKSFVLNMFEEQIKMHQSEKETYDKRLILPYEEVLFEGKKFMGIKGYDYYLTKLYGDYMKLPPKEKRVNHSPYILKFDDGEELRFDLDDE